MSTRISASFTTIASLGVALLGGLAIHSVTFATHHGWEDNYRSANHTRCCAANQDCLIVRARLLSQDDTTTAVEIEGNLVTLPAQSVHQSEDLDDWACLIKVDKGFAQDNICCLFIAAGS